MKRMLVLAGLLVSVAVSAQQAASYQIDLAPTGKLLSIDQPVVKGNSYLFHSYPAGTLMSLRRSQVKLVTKIAPESMDATYRAVSIGNLAMQGGSTQAGPTNLSAVGAKKANTGGLGEGFYSNVIPGQTQAMPNSLNDYQVGRTYAYAPSSATQSAPGAPPTNPSVTNGANPPTMSGSTGSSPP